MLLNSKKDGIDLLSKLDQLNKEDAPPYDDVIRGYIGAFLVICESIQFMDFESIHEFFSGVLKLAGNHCPEMINIIMEREAVTWLKNGFFKEAFEQYCGLSNDDQFKENPAFAIRVKVNRALALYGLKQTARDIVKQRWEEAAQKVESQEDQRRIEENIRLLKKT